VSYSSFFSELQAFHEKYPAIGFCYTGQDYIDANGNDLHIQQKDDTSEIVSLVLHARIAFFTGSIAGCIANTAINKRALDSVGPFMK